jgi:peptide/nickel transport system substrate-binding protein
MRKNKKVLWLVLALLLAMTLAFTACGGNGEEGGNGTGGTTVTEDDNGSGVVIADPGGVTLDRDLEEPIIAEDALEDLRALERYFPVAVHNTNTQIAGGTFNWGRSQTTGFPGLFHPQLSSDAADSNIGNILIYALVGTNDNLTFNNYGPATLEMDVDNLTATISMRPGVQIFWSDGVELTLNDLLYAYYFVSHPDYEGVRFGEPNGTAFVVGAAEFRAGEVDHIAGLTLSADQRTLTIQYTQMPPSMVFAGILTTPLPRHHFEGQGIPVGGTAGHINSRDNLIGFGPFMIEAVVPGESVVLVANENYWQGRPILDRIVYQIVDPEIAAISARTGLVDIVGFRLLDWEDHNDMNNVQFLGRIAGSQSFMYFMLGAMRQCEDTGENYIIPRYDNHPITHPSFRRAIGYAVDRLEIDMTFNEGFARPATTVLHPFNTGRYIDPASRGMSIFDLDRANELLDEAGFERIAGETFRRDLEGNPFYVNLAMTPSAANEVIFTMHQQNFAAIGVDVRPYRGGFFDHNATVTHVTSFENSPNDDMHMFFMGWSMGFNPNPTGLWGHNQNFNLGRFTNETFQSILADIGSMEAWDDDFRADAYRRWAQAFETYVPAIYQSWSMSLYVVNNRVANFPWHVRGSHHPDAFRWHEVALTSDTPYVHR